ncbi:hypothetical protein Zmor_021449 [Zophobas morio]|uniref:Uncharacterized protein n=1 Tax=Zophobas morio TaxID=2755281 RepID=A0AA38I9F9_9CUCU|nr:hypothetical protein Zmor_021449 [Zophobas morio]
MNFFVIITVIITLLSVISVSRSMPYTASDIDEYNQEHEADDLHVAEQLVFRPLFAYRALKERRGSRRRSR